MHEYAHWYCSIANCVKIKSRPQDILQKNGSHFIRKWFLLNSLGICASWWKSTMRCKKFKFWNFWKSPCIWEYALKACNEPTHITSKIKVAAHMQELHLVSTISEVMQWAYRHVASKIRPCSYSFHGHRKSCTSSIREWIFSNRFFEVERSFNA